jgi:hypothetical protein
MVGTINYMGEKNLLVRNCVQTHRNGSYQFHRKKIFYNFILPHTPLKKFPLQITPYHKNILHYKFIF